MSCGCRGSPLSQKVSLRALRQAKGLPLATVLQMENRIVTRMVRGPSDFYEGVRAMLIDRDGAPRWSPASLAEVRPGSPAPRRICTRSLPSSPSDVRAAGKQPGVSGGVFDFKSD